MRRHLISKIAQADINVEPRKNLLKCWFSLLIYTESLNENNQKESQKAVSAPSCVCARLKKQQSKKHIFVLSFQPVGATEIWSETGLK